MTEVDWNRHNKAEVSKEKKMEKIFFRVLLIVGFMWTAFFFGLGFFLGWLV